MIIPEFVIFWEKKKNYFLKNSQFANCLGEIKPSTDEVFTKITAIKYTQTKQKEKIVKSWAL